MKELIKWKRMNNGRKVFCIHRHTYVSAVINVALFYRNKEELFLFGFFLGGRGVYVFGVFFLFFVAFLPSAFVKGTSGKKFKGNTP